jgi:hypothetical protein
VKGVGLLVPLAPIITTNLVDNLTWYSFFVTYNFVLQITMVSLRWLAHVTLVLTIISNLLVLCSVYTQTSLSQVLVVAGLGMLPILPKHLADRACKLSLLGTVLSSGYSLYSTYGVHICIPEPWVVHLSLVVFLAVMALLTELSFLICMKKPSVLNMPATRLCLEAWCLC